MATRIKTPVGDLYEQDLYAWSKAQTDLLRAGRFAELDLGYLIEEIEDVGGALRRSARNRIRTVVEHLLTLEHSPAKEPRAGWRATVRTQGVRLRDALTPALHRQVADQLPSSTVMRADWPKARSATTASMRPQTPCPRRAPTASTRSRPTGCRSAKNRRPRDSRRSSSTGHRGARDNCPLRFERGRALISTAIDVSNCVRPACCQRY